MSTQRRTTIKRHTMKPSPSNSISRRFGAVLSAIWPYINAFLKHQFVLVAVGFVLTGLLATHLTEKINDDRRQREATIHDYDQLRSSIDDLLSSFELYAAASKHAMLALQSDPAEPIRLQAYKDYLAAYATWVQRHSFDYVSINQRFIHGDTASTINKIGSLMKLGTEQLDNCFQSYFNKAVTPRDNERIDLSCGVEPPQLPFTIGSRLISLRQCMDSFARDIRLHPLFDLKGDDARNAVTAIRLDGIDAVCSPERLVGLKMPLRDLPRKVQPSPKREG
ncbi:hypothetical protein CH72_2951 [Burkholderia ambifaria AMMD]|nr:hypothetical protein [Burkholderia ambifaria]AJY21275.1 hypothetical protein CH72_2951 [Burkholderia ambifaria AMMD]MBR7928910.1 hypothetical protein [Burkholderia ambifaria]QQC05368.1 hypothetical protein I6H84_05555 [Burkholderia ambifaria]UZU03851.1 hypothetical protein OR987_26670 [Burkholderia ambifaria]UZU10403.1 hypothetical protein OR988_26665 [Burkholderia ambifaria]